MLASETGPEGMPKGIKVVLVLLTEDGCGCVYAKSSPSGLFFLYDGTRVPVCAASTAIHRNTNKASPLREKLFCGMSLKAFKKRQQQEQQLVQLQLQLQELLLVQVFFFAIHHLNFADYTGIFSFVSFLLK